MGPCRKCCGLPCVCNDPRPPLTPPVETPLQILPSRVRTAAKTCPDVDRAMRQLFPEVFANTEPLEIKKDGTARQYYVTVSSVPGAAYRIKRAQGFRGLELPQVPGYFWVVQGGQLKCMPKDAVVVQP